jgi:LysR family transcriptional regulator, nitrogen assimilation regulatory protein
MDLRSLRYFGAVARLESINKAAAELGITQPALSRQIRLLENELGRPLFLRHGRGVVLTDAGASFLAKTKKALDLLEEAKDEFTGAHPHQGVKQRLVIGLSGAPANLLSPPLLEEFAPAHQELVLEFKTAPNETLRLQLIEGQLDIAVLSAVESSDDFATIPLVTETVNLVRAEPMRGDHRRKVELADFTGLPILTTAFIKDACEKTLAQMFASAGLSLPQIVIADSMTVVHASIQRGQCYYLGPSTSLLHLLAEGRLVTKLIPGVHLTRSIAIPKSKPVSQAKLGVVRFLRSTAVAMVKDGRWPGAWVAAAPET